MWNIKNNTNEYIYKAEKLINIEDKLMVTKEESGVGEGN